MNNQRKILVNKDIQLKELSLNEVEAIFNTLTSQRTYFSEWLPFVENTKEISDTKAFVESAMSQDPLNITCAIYYQDTFVGLIGLKDTDTINRKTEIGYWLSEKYQKKGIITKSCKALIDYAFDKMQMNKVTLKAATGNQRSRAVAERLGFTYEGIEREGEFHPMQGYFDIAVYSLLSSERNKMSLKSVN